MTDETSRLADGMKTRRAVLGEPYVDAAVARTTDFNKDFQEYITRSAWNDVWNRPGLERRMRSVVVLSICIGMHHRDEFRIHLRGGINNGLSKDEIKEILIQAGVYASVPSANHAFKVAAEVFKEMGI